MTTMRDVARRAGVSVATVSHVLNATRPVRPATRDAVLQAIAALGYTHNTLARSLVTSRTRSIGLAVSAVSNPYFTEVLQGVEASTVGHGYGLLIADPHDDPVRELQAVQLLYERRVDGVIVAASSQPARLLRYLSQHGVPTVFLDRLVPAPGSAPTGERTKAATAGGPEPLPPYDQVCTENCAPMAELVRHLAHHGHTRIGLITGTPGLSTTSERIAGYRAGLRHSQLPFDPALMVSGDSRTEGADHATHQVLALPEPPSALITANNAMTIGALRALHGRGLRVPLDIALACFDDFAWADLFHPQLTAVAQPSLDLGTTAVRLLLERLDSPDLPPRTVRLPCAVVHRTSCGCSPATRRDTPPLSPSLSPTAPRLPRPPPQPRATQPRPTSPARPTPDP